MSGYGRILKTALILSAILLIGAPISAFAGPIEAPAQLLDAGAVLPDRLFEARTAERTTDFLVSLFAVSDPGEARGNSITAREILDAGIPLATTQVQYSLLDTRPAKSLADLCAAHGMHLLCYGTLAGGFLSERYLGAASRRSDALVGIDSPRAASDTSRTRSSKRSTTSSFPAIVTLPS